MITPRGKVIETIEERAFDAAIRKSGNITVTVDHDEGHAYASTKDGTLKLTEDAIGLKAEVLITDKTVIDMAKRGKIKGWSFGMYNVIDEMEERADKLPIRHVKSFLLDHIALVKDKVPCYAATSVEYRADESVDIERRALDIERELHIAAENKPDYNE